MKSGVILALIASIVSLPSNAQLPPVSTYDPDGYYMRFGVDQARRGWLTRADVLNTRGLDALLKLVKRA